MARPLKKVSDLHCISVFTSVEAEEAVAALLERTFEETPSIWSNAELNVAVVSVYLKTARSRLTSAKTTLRREVLALGAFELNPGEARVSVRKVRAQDWAESWKRHFKPMSFGNALLVKPTWSRKQPSKGQQLVLLDPGLSFGTGQHATTRFCLESLVESRVIDQHQSFCDMGTGSGILAIAASKLGYEPVDAFDFDPECVRIATENAALNGVTGRVVFAQADLTRVPRKSAKKYDVVCANLIYDLLLQEQARILERLKPGGRLVLAGILETQFAAVQSAYRKAGLKLIEARTEREWRSGVFLAPSKKS